MAPKTTKTAKTKAPEPAIGADWRGPIDEDARAAAAARAQAETEEDPAPGLYDLPPAPEPEPPPPHVTGPLATVLSPFGWLAAIGILAAMPRRGPRIVRQLIAPRRDGGPPAAARLADKAAEVIAARWPLHAAIAGHADLAAEIAAEFLAEEVDYRLSRPPLPATGEPDRQPEQAGPPPASGVYYEPDEEGLVAPL